MGNVPDNLVNAKARYEEARLEYLTIKHTAFRSFAEMCRNKPTLRAVKERDVEEINILRKEYRAETGKEAGK